MTGRESRRGARAVPTERPSFAAAAERHLDDVFRYLLYLTGNRSVAEDLTGATFERAFRDWARYDERRAGVKTWLCQLARTLALDHLRAEARRSRREEIYARRQEREVEPTFSDGLSPALERALAQLSAGERELIALRLLLGVDGATASRLLGISRTACSTRLSRALHKLEKEMHAYA